MSFQSAASSAVWIFGRYSTSDAPDVAQAPMVVDDVERRVDDRRGEAGAVGVAHVAVVEVQPARAEDLRREVELLASSRRSIGRPKKPCAHWFISPATCSATFMNIGIAMDGQLEVALVVERHRRDLAERVLAVEHPAVGAGEQRVGDVADALLDRRVRPGRRAGALNPLALQVRRESRCRRRRRRGRPGPLMLVRGIVDSWVEERDALLVACPRCPPLDAGRHHGFAIRVESRQLFEGVDGFRGVDVRIGMRKVASNLEGSWCHGGFNFPHGI